MKEVLFDASAASQGKWLQDVGFKRKFLRYWGTEMQGGIRVLPIKRIYHTQRGRREFDYVPLLKHLGMYNQLKDNEDIPRHLTSAWLLLDSKKVADITTVTIADKLNNTFLQDDKEVYYIDVGYTDSSPLGRLVKSLEAETPAIRRTKLYEHICRNINTLYEEGRVTGTTKSTAEGSNTIADHAIAPYLLYDDGILKRVLLNSKLKATQRTITSQYGRTKEVIDYSVELTVRVERIDGKEFTEESALVIKIEDEISRKAAIARQVARQITQDGDGVYAYRQLSVHELEQRMTDATVTDDEIWYQGQLRASAFNAKNGVTSKKLNKIIQGALDTGYHQYVKKVAFWKKLLAVIIVIVITVFATIAAPEAWGVLGGLAFGFSMGALGGALLAAAMASWGDDTGAVAMGKIAGIAGKLGSILGIFNIINNVLNSIAAESAKEAIAEEAAKAAGKEFVKKTLIEKVYDMAVSAVVRYIKGRFGDYTNLSAMTVLKSLNQAFSMYQANKLKKSTAEVRKAEAMLDIMVEQEREAEDEGLRGTDYARSMSKMYTMPLSLDQGPFNPWYKYEQTNPVMTLGNIQWGSHKIVNRAWTWEDKKETNSLLS